MRILSQLLVDSLPSGATLCCSDKSFPDLKQEPHWDCTREFLLKSRFSFDFDDIRSIHILVYITILHFMNLLATF